MSNKDDKETKNNMENIPPESVEQKENISVSDNISQEESTDDQSENHFKEKDSETQQSVEENLQDEIYRLKDEKLRLLAEMENLRKRTDKERVDSIRYGSINLARDILSPDDNLSRALEAIPQEEKNSETIKNLIDGLKMVQKEFSSILEKHGVKKIDSLNMRFDHNFHQAMVEIENDEVEPGTVIQEMQSGYIMHDRLLRPSMVSVSKKKNKEEINSDEKIHDKHQK